MVVVHYTYMYMYVCMHDASCSQDVSYQVKKYYRKACLSVHPDKVCLFFRSCWHSMQVHVWWVGQLAWGHEVHVEIQWTLPVASSCMYTYT